MEVADIIHERYKKLQGYESSANITSDEAYVDVSDLDSDKIPQLFRTVWPKSEEIKTGSTRANDNGMPTQRMC